jgi:pyruvate dehydrogenase kinase 2/3/4
MEAIAQRRSLAVGTRGAGAGTGGLHNEVSEADNTSTKAQCTPIDCRRELSTMAVQSQQQHHRPPIDDAVSTNSNSNSSSNSKPTFCSSWFELPATAGDALVKQYAKQKPTSVSLHTLLQTAKGELLGVDKVTAEPPYSTANLTESQQVLLQTASFIRRELPIRLAHRIVELDEAPYLSEMPSVKAVKDTYMDSFLKILQSPEITNMQKEEDFSKLVENLYEKHSRVLLHMARGAFELRTQIRDGTIHIKHPSNNHFNTFDARKDAFKSSSRSSTSTSFDTLQELHDFLDRFYTSRIGIRVLAGQYLALRQHPPVPGYIGQICLHTSPHDVVQEAVDDATFICQKRYGAAPEVNIHGRLDSTFPYIKSHLHYIVLELIKNSMRATVEHHGEDSDESEWPDINVIISDGKENEDVVIKISDQGGGIPRSYVTQKIWSYLFTTAGSNIQEGMLQLDLSTNTTDHGVDAPIAGLGYGLPISRSYARYFGGDLELMSMEGHGTDAFIYLRRLGDSQEPLGI